MANKDENVEPLLQQPDTKCFGDTAGGSFKPAENGDDSDMTNEREAAQYVKQFVGSNSSTLDAFIFIAGALFIESMAFAIASYSNLKPHTDGRSAALLYAIIGSLKPGSGTPIMIIPCVQEGHSRGSRTAVAIFYASGIVSLFSATFTMLLKYYLARFLEGGSMIEHHAELKRRRFDLFVAVPMVIVPIAAALLLFAFFNLATV